MSIQRIIVGVVVLTLSALCWAQASVPASLPATSAPAAAAAAAALPPGSIDQHHRDMATQTLKRGVDFLVQSQQAEGGWGFVTGKSHPALTAMALKVLMQAGFSADSPIVSKGFAAMMTWRQSDGGFYDPHEGNENYCTSLVVMTLAAAKRPQDEGMLRDAVKYLRSEQIVAGSKTPSGQEIAEGNAFIGGVSYGKHGRPDLSNLGMWMEAMHEAGVGGDDPAMQRALTFLKQVQNVKDDDTNPVFLAEPGFLKQEQAGAAQPKAGAESAAPVDKTVYDGGFIYAVNCKDGHFVRESQAGEAETGGLRSYGSMTYSGFKSMLYANLRPGDKRVQAALDWIRGHWQLDANPNMPESMSRQGLYYYYQVFAKALRVWGESVIVDSQGFGHNWRHELVEHLAKEQQADGSWTNAADRWMESNPVLVTCYACMALQDALAQ